MVDWIREITLAKRMVSGLAAAFIGLLMLSLTFISCGDGNGDGDGGSTGIPIFPPTVFTAAKDVAGRVELYASFDDGREIIKLSADLVSGGNVVDFKISPDGIFAAYVADQKTDQVFELYVVPVDKNFGDRAVKVSGFFMAGDGIKEISPGDYAFEWSPDSSRVAYLADQRVAGVIELFSSEPSGSNNARLSQLPATDREVEEFKWAPDSRQIAYRADQEINDVADLYTTSPTELISLRITSGLGPGQQTAEFNWAPNSSRIAFIADKTAPGLFQLWTTSPNDANNVLVSGSLLNPSSEVVEFAWAPDSSLIAYIADDENDEVFELFTTRPAAPPNRQNFRRPGE